MDMTTDTSKSIKNGSLKRVILCAVCAVVLGFPILVGTVSCSSMPMRWWMESTAGWGDIFHGQGDIGAALAEEASIFPVQVPEVLNSEAAIEINSQGRLDFDWHPVDVFSEPLAPLFPPSCINGDLSLDFENSSFIFSSLGGNSTGTFEYSNGEEAIERLGKEGLSLTFLNTLAWRASNGSHETAISCLSLTPSEVESVLPSRSELLTETGQPLILIFLSSDGNLQVYAPQWNEFGRYETD